METPVRKFDWVFLGVGCALKSGNFAHFCGTGLAAPRGVITLLSREIWFNFVFFRFILQPRRQGIGVRGGFWRRVFVLISRDDSIGNRVFEGF